MYRQQKNHFNSNDSRESIPDRIVSISKSYVRPIVRGKEVKNMEFGAMDKFCTDLLRLAMDHNYRPEFDWKKIRTKLSSFDVRHLVWSIVLRLGLGKGKVYSNDDCACYIEHRFASLCVTASG